MQIISQIFGDSAEAALGQVAAQLAMDRIQGQKISQSLRGVFLNQAQELRNKKTGALFSGLGVGKKIKDQLKNRIKTLDLDRHIKKAENAISQISTVERKGIEQADRGESSIKRIISDIDNAKMRFAEDKAVPAPKLAGVGAEVGQAKAACMQQEQGLYKDLVANQSADYQNLDASLASQQTADQKQLDAVEHAGLFDKIFGVFSQIFSVVLNAWPAVGQIASPIWQALSSFIQTGVDSHFQNQAEQGQTASENQAGAAQMLQKDISKQLEAYDGARVSNNATLNALEKASA